MNSVKLTAISGVPILPSRPLVVTFYLVRKIRIIDLRINETEVKRKALEESFCLHMLHMYAGTSPL